MNSKTIPGSISLSIADGRAGTVTDNELNLGGFSVQQAGMNFSLKSDGSELTVSCKIK